MDFLFRLSSLLLKALVCGYIYTTCVWKGLQPVTASSFTLLITKVIMIFDLVHQADSSPTVII